MDPSQTNQPGYLLADPAGPARPRAGGVPG